MVELYVGLVLLVLAIVGWLVDRAEKDDHDDTDQMT